MKFFLGLIAIVHAVQYDCSDIQKMYEDRECCTNGDFSCSIPTSDTVEWGADYTYALASSQFVRMHNTIISKVPFNLGSNESLQYGIGNQDGDVTLNRYIGAAHAMCFSMSVQQLPSYNFRICTAAEVLALSSVMLLDEDKHIVTYASSDGDDYETGKVLHTISVKNDYPSYSYGNSPLSPPNPPASPEIRMQTFTGSDDETNLGKIDSYKNMIAYCCSGVYTLMDSEGAS